jgi:hypothetical protein
MGPERWPDTIGDSDGRASSGPRHRLALFRRVRRRYPELRPRWRRSPRSRLEIVHGEIDLRRAVACDLRGASIDSALNVEFPVVSMRQKDAAPLRT